MYTGSRYCSPGDTVPASGAYRAVHAGHREEHMVIAMRGEVFPYCRHCRERVRFILQIEAEFVVEDNDLTGLARAIS